MSNASDNQTQKLVQQLINQINTAVVLKTISESLEELSLNKHFKDHLHAIATDPDLTPAQKKTQLSYVIRSIEIPELYQFFSDRIDQQDFWLFESGKIDYFDRFVQSFQSATQSVEIIHLTSALPLSDKFQRQIVKDLSHSFSKKVILNLQLKPSILGGIQVKLENLIFDYSLKYKFRQFEQQWIRSLRKTEKTTGRNLPDQL